MARHAAQAGLSTLLVEADDFAAGTSSRSTKLIHGGLRYLAMGEVGLVREGALERKSLVAMAVLWSLATLAGAWVERHAPVTEKEVRALKDEDLPTYTILVPVYREANVVGLLMRNLARMDYPKEKLEILVLIEEDDPETLEELDKRQEEITEQFMELSLNTKHDLREKIMAEFPDIEPSELKQRLKEVDQKRKDGLKVLKNKLADIIQDEELNGEQKLQKLYDESEITEFMQNLLI